MDPKYKKKRYRIKVGGEYIVVWSNKDRKDVQIKYRRLHTARQLQNIEDLAKRDTILKDKMKKAKESPTKELAENRILRIKKTPFVLKLNYNPGKEGKRSHTGTATLINGKSTKAGKTKLLMHHIYRYYKGLLYLFL